MNTPSLTFATFNIRNGRGLDGRNAWPFRRGATARALRELNADVVCLQECYGFQQRYLQRSMPGYDASGRGRGRHRGGERCTTLTRRSRLGVLAQRTRWFGDSPDRPGTRLAQASFPRVATMTRLIDQQSGLEFDVINTHLDERHPDNRVRSVKQLVSWVDSTVPSVVLGDLNTTQADRRLFSSFEAVGFRPALAPHAGGTTHQFTGMTTGPQIDHILLSPEWELVNAEVVTSQSGNRLPSDHFPVRVVAILGS